MNQSNFQSNFYLSPNISRNNTYEIPTRYSAINPMQQSQFMEEDQVQNIITSTTIYNPAPPVNTCSTQQLINQIQRANQSVCQMTNDLRNLNDSIRKRTGLEDTRKSAYSLQQNSVSPVSNDNMNGTNIDYSFPSLVQKTSRFYTSHANYTEIPLQTSQNLNAPLRSSQYIENLKKSTNNLKQSAVAPETNPLRVSSYHDGNQTVINFPFLSYSKDNQDEEIADTRANYKSTVQTPKQKEEDENLTRRYYIKHEDLEYEEYEDFENPSNNYKKIKYPYSSNWQTIYQTPGFIQNIIHLQKSRSDHSEVDQSQQLADNQQTVQQQEAVKYSNYLLKSSFNLLDDTQYRSQTETNNTLSGSYIASSANNIPYSYY
ncbi:hypothetical protein ABPG72_002821 [Tetrahymena utriculariae]